ncbi:MAG TPA: hypothetical protein VF135_02100 [Terriglobales bacterium]
MKFVSLFLALSSVFALGQSTPQSAPSGQDKSLAAIAAQDPNTKKAKDLLHKMVAALGGQTYLTYQTMTQEGRTYSFYQGQPNSAGNPFWRFYRYPDKDRLELTKQRDVIYIFNGDKGYEVTFKGTAAVEPKELQDYLLRRKYSLDNIVRVWMNNPKTLIIYEGSGLADQQFVEQVTLINGENDSVTIGIDPNTGLPLKKSFSYRDYDGLKSTDDEVYANYRDVQGIQTPHSIVRYHNGLQSGQRFLSKVEYNVPLSENLFQAKVTYEMYKLNRKK